MRHVGAALSWAGAQAADRASERMSRPWPPASRPSEPPRRRTGDLASGLRVSEPEISSNVVTVVISSTRNGSDEVPWQLQEVMDRDILRTEERELRNGRLAGDVGDIL